MSAPSIGGVSAPSIGGVIVLTACSSSVLKSSSSIDMIWFWLAAATCSVGLRRSGGDELELDMGTG